MKKIIISFVILIGSFIFEFQLKSQNYTDTINHVSNMWIKAESLPNKFQQQ